MIKISDYKLFFSTGKCSYCENNIVIHRRYSGEKLCPKCFKKNIEKIIYKTISKYKMLNREDKIVVALSGGKDSITLLYNLIKIQKNKHISEPLVALSIDEGIKDYRNKSLEIAKKFCRENNIEHKIISFKERMGYTLDEIVNMKKKTSDALYACNYCALLRRRLLNEGAKELNADVLAIGHNLTDIAETFLMNILFKRIELIGNQYLFRKRDELNKYFVKKITPLMRIPEEEIFLYVNLKKLNYYASHCPYREEDPIIRKRVLEFIQNCKNTSPEIEFNLLNGFLELSEILYKHQTKKKEFNICEVCGYPSFRSKICSFCRFLKTLK
ncbi:MAG: TIGR00269 family protein [Promethearchaeia archaeon]